MQMDRMLSSNPGQSRTTTHEKRHTGLPGDPPGIVSSMTLFGGKVYTLPEGNKSCGLCAPLKICNSTGAVGGTNETPLTENREVAWSSEMARLMRTSAPSGVGRPGAPGLITGWRLVSKRGFVRLGVWFVRGSCSRAFRYRRIARLSPPSKPVHPMLGFARIQ